MSNNFTDSLKVENLKPLQILNDTEKEILYRDFVDSQKKHFEAYIKFLNAELCVLKHYRIVSDFTRFLARIKSAESSIKNDQLKALNDVFGLEVDSATPGEVAFIVMLFKDTLTETKESVKNKENKYVAHHYSGYPRVGNIVEKLEEMLKKTYKDKALFDEYMEKLPHNIKEDMTEKDKNSVKKYFEDFCKNLNNYIIVINNTVKGEKLKDLKRDLRKPEQEYRKLEKLEYNENQPIIESQFKTIQTAIEANLGTASHGDYKGEDMREVQKEYDQHGGLPLSRVPVMYKSNLEIDEKGMPIPPRLLSSDEAAKVLYPSLIVGKKGEKWKE